MQSTAARTEIARSTPAIATASSARRAGGVKGGSAAERSEGTLDAAEHRAPIERRWPGPEGSALGGFAPFHQGVELAALGWRHLEHTLGDVVE